MPHEDREAVCSTAWGSQLCPIHWGPNTQVQQRCTEHLLLVRHDATSDTILINFISMNFMLGFGVPGAELTALRLWVSGELNMLKSTGLTHSRCSMNIYLMEKHIWKKQPSAEEVKLFILQLRKTDFLNQTARNSWAWDLDPGLERWVQISPRVPTYLYWSSGNSKW